MAKPIETGKAARYYIEKLGWYVVPIWPIDNGRCGCGTCDKPGKHPMFAFQEATNDVEVAGRIWREEPEAGVAINMEKSGLFGLDVDEHHGGTWRQLRLSPAELRTPTARSGSDKGDHKYWLAPQNLKISQSTELMPAGIDPRYYGVLIAPPSLHVSKNRYAWYRNLEPWSVKPLPLPMSLLPYLKFHNWPESDPGAAAAPPELAIGGERRLTAYVETAVQEEVRFLSQQAEGNRNNALNRASYSLGQLLAVVDTLSRSQIEELLKQTGLSIGLGEREIEKTIASGINAGLKNPRKLPDFS